MENGSHSHVCLLFVKEIKLVYTICINNNLPMPTYYSNWPMADNRPIPIIGQLLMHL